MKKLPRLLSLVALLAVVLASQAPQPLVLAQTPTPDPSLAHAQSLLKEMSPEERVGQLFLVTFKGTDISASSQIYDLIVNHYIGGVVLSAKNDNFAGGQQLINQTYQLISQLQTDKWQASQETRPNLSGTQPTPPVYVPLFIGISQDGDGYPNDQILSGLSPLPDEMALGATWNPKLAEGVGSVLGQELQALGFNLLLGPSLDVTDSFQQEGSDYLGTNTFGGDPYWVGLFGQSYIAGLHEGSNGRMAVIADHFPGLGSSDRPPEDEVATVRKPLQQLTQIDLAPFFAVTGKAPDANSTTDALLVSPIRVQGLQGNIRDATKPISFDANALSILMGLPDISSWREKGGVMVSDDLGSRAIRRYYDPLGVTFDSRQVALNAFLAGNDILYADNFQASGDADTYTSIVRTLDYFTQKYRDDSAFAQRVDASVVRILALKLRMYKTFSLPVVIPSDTGLGSVGTSQVSFDIARNAATLISPDPADLDAVLPNPPGALDRIVFITDVMPGRQCSTCTEQVTLPVDALQSTVMRLYGPQAGGKVFQNRLSSYSFTDLDGMLNGAQGLPPLENDLRTANWVVFAMLNITQDRPDSQAIRRLLSERPDLLRNKHVIVFSFNAPYYLDATDISKITAYYALYSKIPAFVEVAARVLFQELPPKGALPVSVPAIGYDLYTATSPDPDQVIPLYLDIPEATPTPQVTNTPGTPAPTKVPTFKVGDTIPLRTGVIQDHNGHPVPDGTVAHFIITRGGESGATQQIQATTIQGVARTTFRIDGPGLLEIRVESDPAKSSDILRLDITGSTSAAITLIAPSPIPTETALPTATPSPTPTPIQPAMPPHSAYPLFGEWIIAMIVILGGAATAYSAGNWWFSLQWGVRWGLCASLGGLLAYLYLAIGLPGGGQWLRSTGTAGIIAATLLGVLLGLGGGLVWRSFLLRNNKAKI